MRVKKKVTKGHDQDAAAPATTRVAPLSKAESNDDLEGVRGREVEEEVHSVREVVATESLSGVQRAEGMPSGVCPLPVQGSDGDGGGVESGEGVSGSLFDEIDVPSAVTVRSDGLPALDSDLTPDQKREFLNLIRKEMPIAERAKQLATLARFTDTKRAPVALRAIVEMNVLDGLHEDKATDAPPLFVLPEDAKMAVLVQKVAK